MRRRGKRRVLKYGNCLLRNKGGGHRGLTVGCDLVKAQEHDHVRINLYNEMNQKDKNQHVKRHNSANSVVLL